LQRRGSPVSVVNELGKLVICIYLNGHKDIFSMT
jgi:hypothetical protein